MARWWRRDSATADVDAQSEAPAEDESSAGGGSSAAGPSSSVPEAASSPVPGWQQVEPLRPVVASALSGESASEPLEFVRTLSSRWQQPPVVAPLGHNVSPEAMGGIVGGIVAALPSSTYAAEAAELPELRWAAPQSSGAINGSATAATVQPRSFAPAPAINVAAGSEQTTIEPARQSGTILAAHDAGDFERPPRASSGDLSQSTTTPNAASPFEQTGAVEAGQSATSSPATPSSAVPRPIGVEPIGVEPLGVDSAQSPDLIWRRPPTPTSAAADSETSTGASPVQSAESAELSRPLVSVRPLSAAEPLINVRRPLSDGQPVSQDGEDQPSDLNFPVGEPSESEQFNRPQNEWTPGTQDETVAAEMVDDESEQTPPRGPGPRPNTLSFVDNSASTPAPTAASSQEDATDGATPPTIGQGLGPILRRRRGSARPVVAEGTEPAESSEPSAGLLAMPLSSARTVTSASPTDDTPTSAVETLEISDESALTPARRNLLAGNDDVATDAPQELTSAPEIESAPILARRAMPALRGIVSRARPSLEPQVAELAELPASANPEPPIDGIPRALVEAMSSPRRGGAFPAVQSAADGGQSQPISPTVTYTAQEPGVNSFPQTPPDTIQQLVGHAIPAGVLAQPAAATSPSSPSREDRPASSTEGAPDAEHLDRLADQLYGRLRSQLSSELLIGRERSQMLTDL